MKELAVALIGGAGFMGKAHSLALALAPIAQTGTLRIRRRVLVETDMERAVSSARELGWEQASDSWREVIERDDIDIVDVCTPPQFHREIALAAIAAGKHIFCEKPLSNDLGEAHEMADAAREAGVVAQVGFNYRHTPAVAFAKQLLDRGELGTPLFFRGMYLQETAFGADPHRWRAQRSTGGSGTVGDIGSHVIDVAELLFGPIVRVSARARTLATDETGWISEEERTGRDLVDDAAMWMAEFENGALGSFAVSSVSSGRKNQLRFEFDTTTAAVAFDWNDREAFQVSYRDEASDHQGFRRIHTSAAHPNGWWRLAGLGTGYVEVSAIQFQRFIDAIATGSVADPDFAHAAHVQELVAAIYDSAAEGRWVTVGERS